MELWNQILFFLAGLGVFNGILLSVYFLLLIKPRRSANIVFGFFMLMLCIRIGKSLFHSFTEIDRIYLQIGLSACIMIGPFLSVYIDHFTNTKTKLDRKNWLFLLVPFCSILVIGLVWPYEQYPQHWNPRIVLFIYGTWIFYMLLTLKQVIPTLKKTISKQGEIADYWILLIYSCTALLCLAYSLALVGFPYLAAPLLFSFVLYVIIGFLFTKSNRLVVFQKGKSIKYKNQKIEDSKSEEMLDKLSSIMRSEKLYLDKKIKLAQVANSIGSSPHELSQVINDRLEISFNQYINEYRVKEACILLKENSLLTIEGIGAEVGFSSRSAFYSAFKSVMNQTPGQFQGKKSEKSR